MRNAYRAIRAAAPRYRAAAGSQSAPARASVFRTDPPRRRHVGPARAFAASPVRHRPGLRRGQAARRRAGRSPGGAGPALHTGGGNSRHSELGKVMAGASQPLRLARGERHPAGTLEPAAPVSAASLELVLPHPADLHGDGGDLPAPVPGAGHARDRRAAGGAVPRGLFARRFFGRPQPLAGRRSLRADRACGSRRDSGWRGCSNGSTENACAPGAPTRSSGASSGSCRPPATPASPR